MDLQANASIFAVGWKGHTESEQREASQRIAELLRGVGEQFEAAKTEAVNLANEFGIEIYLAPGGYGTGSTYYPVGDGKFESSNCSDYGDPVAGEWYSSSNC